MAQLRTLRCFLLLLVLVLESLESSGQDNWNCPAECKCLWQSGRKAADCAKQRLQDIPDTIPTYIQYLNMNNNLIEHLPANLFINKDIINLHKLFLRDNRIKTVHVNAFSNLKIIIEIDLTNNHIKKLHPGTFDETARLRTLLLNNNYLEHLESNLFHDLEFIQKIEISNNRIEYIAEDAFHNLTGLSVLSLDGNNLTTLKVQSFEILPKLGSLALLKNPWNCNCLLKKFRDWAIMKNLVTNPTSCNSPPSLAGRMWLEIPEDEFACRPKILAIGPALRTEVGQGDAYLWCRATGIPRPKIFWFYRSKVLTNSTKRPSSDKGFIIVENLDWSNLTIPEVMITDKGEYICAAKNYGGTVERNISLIIVGDNYHRESTIGLPLAIALGVIAFFFLLAALTLCLCYCRKHRKNHDEKNQEASSLDHHGLGEQEKSLITAINPVVKPPRRYDAPSVTSHGTEMTELNRTLLDNDSVFVDGIGSVVGVIANGLNEDERLRACTPDYEGLGSPIVSGTLPRGMAYRQYPPDLLAFSGGRNSSPTSQASTAPDNSRLPTQFLGPYGSGPSSPSGYNHPSAFKTLPHPVRSSSATPYSMANLLNHPSMSRYGLMTIPRRPRAPSWSSPPPLSRGERSEASEPVYDNLGRRTRADGSCTTLNKSPEPNYTMRGRPLPSTPTQFTNTSINSCGKNGSIQPRHRANRTATPIILAQSPIDQQAMEIKKHTIVDRDERDLKPQQKPEQLEENGPTRKIPPRPPPKPKKKNANGPLFEDEGEDGTEV